MEKNTNNSIDYLSSLKYPDFLKMWLAGLFAGSSHWALIVVRGWVVYQISDSSMYVGLVTFAALIPMVIVNPFIGYLADKFQRRRILQIMFFINFAHNLGLAFLYFLDLIVPWHLVILAFVQGSARASQMPSGQALVPNIVPKKNLLNAVALNASTIHATRLLGPLAIAPFISYIDSNERSIDGTDIAFFICTAFYLLSFIFSMMIQNKSTGKINSESFFKGFAEGVRYVHSNKPILIIIIITTLHCMLTMSFESILPYFSVNKLGAEGPALSFLMMCVGIGALNASVFLAGTSSEKLKGKLFYYFAILSGIAPLVLSFSTNLLLSMFGTVLMGLGQAGFMIISQTLIQVLAPDYIRGRIVCIYAMYAGGSMALFNFINGLLADLINPGYSLAVQGILFSSIVIIYRNQKVLRFIYSGKANQLVKA